MVCVRMLDPSLPQFGRRAALIRTDESVERALRQRQRHIGPGRDVGDRMHEGDAPRNTGASGTANFEPIEIVEPFNSLLGQVPVLVTELQPAPENMRVQLCLKLLFDQGSWSSVCAAADNVDRLSIEDGQ